MANIFNFDYIFDVEFNGAEWVPGGWGIFDSSGGFSLGDGTVDSASDDGLLNWGDSVYLSTNTGIAGPVTYITGAYQPLPLTNWFTMVVVQDAASGLYFALTDDVGFFGDTAGLLHGNPDTGASTESTAFQYYFDIHGLNVWQGNTLANYAAGNDGNDLLDGCDGNDTLYGGDGDDTLVGGAGADWMKGGIGNDTYDLGNDISDTYLFEDPGEGTDTILLSYNNYSLVGTNIENLTLTGGEGGNYAITGSASDNVITALIDAGTATFAFNGGDGNDTLNGAGGNDTLNGAGGNDTLSGGAGADSLIGGAGDDTYVLGNDTTDTLVENPGDGTDTVLVNYINYTLTAASVENVTLTGGEGGSYTVTGSTADNVITALIDAGSATFVLNGGDGHDTLNGAAFNDTLNGGTGRDVLNGGAGDDSLLGGGSNDALNGGDGNDYLDGGGSNDRLFGNLGRDTLHGGAGDDTLAGAGGRDVFLFDANLGGSGVDTITDFLVGTDKIYIAVGVSGLGYTGVLSAANFVSGAGASTADQHFVYDSSNLYYDADGSGAGAQVQFATFSNAAVLSASDIVIV